MKMLGFGLMRPPMIGGEPDLEQVKQMVDLFLAEGFHYFDTAYAYFEGGNERMIREALVKRYPRDAYTLADKLPIWVITEKGMSPEEILRKSLENAGVEYFDYYLLHALSGEKIVDAEKLGLWDFIKDVKARGLAKSIGFSFHGTADQLEELLKLHPEAEFVQLQINYADWENDRVQSRACYEVARRFEKPIVIMEPVKGGSLSDLGSSVSAPFEGLDPSMSLSARALRFAAALPGIRAVLSGMSNLAQMQENIVTLAEKPILSDAEKEAYGKVQELLAAADTVPCTGCRYCLEACPIGMEIPRLFRIENQYRIFGSLDKAKADYAKATAEHPKAGDCLGCYACAEHCPQHLEIPELLRKVAGNFE